MTRALRILLGLISFSLLVVTRSCSQANDIGSTSFPNLATRSAIEPMAERLHQRDCADTVVRYISRRDGLEPYVVVQEIQLEPRNRIRVFFRFRHDMRTVFAHSRSFVRFPAWLGGGRYASNYGRGEPGFEIHLDARQPDRTVNFEASKSSDVDQHEPAGDVASVVLHGVNVIEHELGQPEVAPCELLAHFREGWQRRAPRSRCGDAINHLPTSIRDAMRTT